METTPAQSAIHDQRVVVRATPEEEDQRAAPFGLTHGGGAIDKAPPWQAGAPVDGAAYPAGAWGLGAPLATARYRLAGVTDNNQRYFAIGGNDGTNDLAVNAVYNPTTNSWTTLAPMPTARMNIQAAHLSGLLYVPGGYLASSDTFVSIHEAYDIARNTWATKAPLPQPLSGAMTAAAGGKVYVFGGNNGGGRQTTTYQYDPGANTWVTRAVMPIALSYGGAVEYGGRIYVMTGITADSSLSSVFPSATIQAAVAGPRDRVSAPHACHPPSSQPVITSMSSVAAAVPTFGSRARSSRALRSADFPERPVGISE